MTIFDFENYRLYIAKKIERLPKRGRGEFRKLALATKTSPVFITQVMKGDRDFTPDQALLVAEHFGLSTFQRKYLLRLVDLARAETPKYRDIIKNELKEMRDQSKKVTHQVEKSLKLSDEATSVLYSNWYYLAIWSLTAIPGLDQIETIASYLSLNRKKASEALEFLIKQGLVVEVNGKLRMGPNLVHLDAESPQISRHHQSWRLQAFSKYEKIESENLFYTAPVTLSEKDATQIRNSLLEMISRTVKQISESPSEKFYCLCLDWFKV